MPLGSTRSHVLAFIVAHGGATVAELAHALSLADATIRRHLDKLEVEGLLTDHAVHQPTGRPYRRYQATAAGVSQERDHSQVLAARLISQIERGEAHPDNVAEGLADQVAAQHRDQIHPDASLEQRVASTVDALRREGILDDWERTENGFRLHNHGCPYRSAADTSDCVCESDRLAIEKLLGQHVDQLDSLVHGGDSCEYLVETAAIEPGAIQPETNPPPKRRPPQS